MDESSESTIWQRLAKIFSNKDEDSVEKAIRDASNEGELDKEEGSMLLNILTLDELQVQEVMTPRTDIVCAPKTASIQDIATIILESGHSRIPLFEETRDNFVGIVFAKDLLKHMLCEKSNDLPATSIMREPFFIPETKKVLALLHEFRSKKTHLAIILDEYGGTSGIITIEDVLEEIVGEIEDEYDMPKEKEIIAQENNCYIVSGRTFLEDIAEKIGLNISSEEVDTIGGYLTLIAGRVPKQNEEFVIDGYRLIILEANHKQIQSIQVYPPESYNNSDVVV